MQDVKSLEAVLCFGDIVRSGSETIGPQAVLSERSCLRSALLFSCY